MKLTLEVTGDQEKRLAEVARRLNVPADELAGALVRDLLSQREADFSEGASTRGFASVGNQGMGRTKIVWKGAA